MISAQQGHRARPGITLVWFSVLGFVARLLMAVVVRKNN
jgi:hypothetical protein